MPSPFISSQRSKEAKKQNKKNNAWSQVRRMYAWEAIYEGKSYRNGENMC